MAFRVALRLPVLFTTCKQRPYVRTCHECFHDHAAMSTSPTTFVSHACMQSSCHAHAASMNCSTCPVDCGILRIYYYYCSLNFKTWGSHLVNESLCVEASIARHLLRCVHQAWNAAEMVLRDTASLDVRDDILSNQMASI